MLVWISMPMTMMRGATELCLVTEHTVSCLLRSISTRNAWLQSRKYRRETPSEFVDFIIIIIFICSNCVNNTQETVQNTVCEQDSNTTLKTKWHLKHLRNLEKKLMCMIEHLNFDSVLKSTLSGSEFHTLATRSLKKAAVTCDTLRFLYSLMIWWFT